jgi:sterol desaturase/sphingolipid hydroxylase (fatty acid hydroxylase superfamily)
MGSLCAGIWTGWLLLLQFAVWAHVSILRKTHLKRYGPIPKLSSARLLAESVIGYNAWTWLLGAFAAWLNPGAAGGMQWDYSCPNIMVLGYFCLAMLMPYDIWSFFTHKWMHDNKTAFRYLHRKHHEMKASLNVLTSAYMSAAEGQITVGIPMVGIYAAGVATGNWWYCMAGEAARCHPPFTKGFTRVCILPSVSASGG